jgi:hypothetical protein
MAEVCWGAAKYLVLHFTGGQLTSTKVCHSWRGAMMSKANHERPYPLWPEKLMQEWKLRRTTKILPIAAILQMTGLDAPTT